MDWIDIKKELPNKKYIKTNTKFLLKGYIQLREGGEKKRTCL